MLLIRVKGMGVFIIICVKVKVIGSEIIFFISFFLDFFRYWLDFFIYINFIVSYKCLVVDFLNFGFLVI